MPRKNVWKLTLKPCSGCGKPTPSQTQVCESCTEGEIQVPATGDRKTFTWRSW